MVGGELPWVIDKIDERTQVEHEGIGTSAIHPPTDVGGTLAPNIVEELWAESYALAAEKGAQGRIPKPMRSVINRVKFAHAKRGAS